MNYWWGQVKPKRFQYNGEEVKDIEKGGGQNSAHSEGGEIKYKEHFKRKSTEFLLKSWSGDQKFFINLIGGYKNSIKHMTMSYSLSLQVINDSFFNAPLLLEENIEDVVPTNSYVVMCKALFTLLKLT